MIQLAMQESARDSALAGTSESREKLLAKVAYLHRTFRRLGFSNSQVREAWQHASKLDFDEICRWIYLRYTPASKHSAAAAASTDENDVEGFTHYGIGDWPILEQASAASASSSTAASSSSITAFPPLPSTGRTTPALAEPPLKSNPSDVTPPDARHAEKSSGKSLFAFRRPTSDSDDDSDSDSDSDEDGESSHIQPVKVAQDHSRNGTLDTSLPTDSDIEEDPDTAYVTLKLRLTSLQRKMGIAGKAGKKGGKVVKAKSVVTSIVKPKSAEDAELELLESRLKAIQGLYLFNAKQAEATFAVERAKLDKQELAERLAGKAKERAQPKLPATKPRAEAEPAASAGSTPNEGIEDANEDDPVLSAIFEEADSTPAAAEDAETVKVRSMPLPKNYTGKTPRSLLDEAVRRLDRYAKTTYRVSSRASSAVRAVVTIRWESGRIDQYGMPDEACENQDQAFQYVATLALFANTPATDGSVIRLLPANFRDLWDELVSRRNRYLQEADRSSLAMYEEIVDGRVASSTNSVGSIRPDFMQRSKKRHFFNRS